MLGATLAYFAEIKSLLICVVIFSFADFVTGIFAARKKNIPITSGRMRSKIKDIAFYWLAIILSYIFWKLFQSYVDYQVHKLAAFIVLSVEFYSNMENISVITDIPLLGKDKLHNFLKKLIDENKRV